MQEEDIWAEMTRDGLLYTQGFDYWGTKAEDTAQGRMLSYVRESGSVSALITRTNVRGNGHTIIKAQVVDKSGTLQELSDLATIPNELEADEFGSIQVFIDRVYFKDK